MVSLVGYTGFVGSNIYDKGKAVIDKVYNSKNIEEAYGTEPDLLVYAGVRAEKYLANTNPDADLSLIHGAEKNIAKIALKKLVLISTIDVLKDPLGKDEDCRIDTKDLQAYGYNRYQLEQWTRENYPDALIIRLPGLYGINIKKNFIYDYINIIPFMLSEEKFIEFSGKNPVLKEYYEKQPNGFYKCRQIDDLTKVELRKVFKQLGFTTLNFSDSRNVYQFYPLARLWEDINTASEARIKLLHLATEPVSAAEVYEYLSGEKFVNECSEKPVFYDCRTKHGEMSVGNQGYLMSKEQVLDDIKQFVGKMKK